MAKTECRKAKGKNVKMKKGGSSLMKRIMKKNDLNQSNYASSSCPINQPKEKTKLHNIGRGEKEGQVAYKFGIWSYSITYNINIYIYIYI